MTITFITGANKGLSHETARRLIEIGHTVLVGPAIPNKARRSPRRSGRGSSAST